MTSTNHPAVRAVGGYLRDARERRYMLPVQAADELEVSEETLLAMEAGHLPAPAMTVDRLCRLYRCTDDTGALQNLLIPRDGSVRDEAPGHHRRLAGCMRQAREVLWIATSHLPPLVQTPAYAHATSSPPCALPGAPLAPAAEPQLLLDERILLTEDIAPEVMEPQLLHLLEETGCRVGVMPGQLPASLGPVVVLRMAAGFVLAEPSPSGVRYRADEHPARRITDAWDLTTPAGTWFLLNKALYEQRARLPGQNPGTPAPVPQRPARSP
ncbi:helix-turn-helix domain-containing protein [Streptomyces sp. NPDC015350]|uniref:helix-turn-helix domain-containing protein n=1 Tax=Streptomyces sp. NPDC015350 TaxID=3364955 RepID=UPI0037009A77